MDSTSGFAGGTILVRRRIYPTVPPRVEYSLTDLGRSAARLLDGMCDWAENHGAEIDRARIDYDNRPEPSPVG